jgi:hypothetical protein
MGDSDAEMIALIEGTLKEFINKQLSGQKDWMGEQFKEFEVVTAR